MSLFVYLLLTLLSIPFLYYVIKSRIILTSVFYVVFCIYYVWIPTFLLYYDSIGKLSSYGSTYFIVISSSSDSKRIQAALVTLLVMVLLVALVRVFFKFGDKSIGNVSIKDNYDSLYLSRYVYRIGLVFTIVGIVCLVELMFELGGLGNMLSLGSVIRGYRTDKAEYLSAVGAICKTLSIFVTGGFICLFATRKSSESHIMLIVSGFFSIVYLLFDAGRGPLLLFLGCIVFALLEEHNKKVVWVVIAGYIAIALTSSSIEVVMNNISVGRSPLLGLNYSVSNNLLATFTDLSYPFANLLSFSSMIHESGYNYGLDYLTWIFQIIPQRLFLMIGIPLPNITLVTTKVSLYYFLKKWTLGGTPVDFLTYGLFQFNVIGLIINCIIIDSIIKQMDCMIKLLPNEYSIIKYRLCFMVYSFITNGDMPLLIKNNLFLFIIVILISRFIMSNKWISKDEVSER